MLSRHALGMTERASSARVKLQCISEAVLGVEVGGDGSWAERDDGKSAFGVSEVAMPKRSFQRGVVRGDGGSSRRIRHAKVMILSR